MSETNGAVKQKRKPAKRVTRRQEIDAIRASEQTEWDKIEVSGPTNEQLASLASSPDVATLAASFGYDLASSLVVDTQPAEPTSYQVHLEPLKQTKKIAIVGKAPSTIPLAPYNDPEWEIWGLSDLILHEKCTRWTRWFELHDPEGWHPDDSVPRRKKWHPKYWEHLTKQHEPGKVIYLAESHPEMPYAELFPYQRLIDKYSLRDKHGQPKPYFTNTVSWLIAFAIDQGATHLSIYGVDMAQQEKGVKSEYAYQRPSVEYFIGWAAGYGVEVYIPEESDLMKASRLYGIDRLSPNMRSLHRKRKKDLANLRQDVEQKLAQAKQQLRDLELRQHVIIGAQDDNDQWWSQQVV